MAPKGGFFQTGKCCLTFQQLWVWKGPVKMKRIEMLRRRMTTDNSTGHCSLDYFAATAVNLHVLGTTSSEWRDLLSWTAIMESGLKKNHTRIIEQVTPQKLVDSHKVECSQKFNKHFFLHLSCRLWICNQKLRICLDLGGPVVHRLKNPPNLAEWAVCVR